MEPELWDFLILINIFPSCAGGLRHGANTSDCLELDISSKSESSSELLDVSDGEKDLFRFGDEDVSELEENMEGYC